MRPVNKERRPIEKASQNLDPIARDATHHLRAWERLLDNLNRTHTRARRAKDRQQILDRAGRYAGLAKAIFDQHEDQARISRAIEWSTRDR